MNPDIPQTQAEAPAVLRPATSNANYNIAPDQFERVIAPLPEDQQDVIRWWYFLGKDRSWTLTQLAKASGSSSTTLSRVFRGEYGADLGNLCDALTRARDSFAESVNNPEFIQTSLASQLFAICDRTRNLRTVAFAQGVMGNGKTTALEEYKRRNNHGRTIYYRCEPGLTLVQFISSLASACGVGFKSKQTQLRIREKLYTLLGAGQRLLIIDELHQLFLRREKSDITPIQQCEFLRCLYDKSAAINSGCGMLLVSTDALDDYLTHAGPALAQLLDRGTIKVILPPKPTPEDARALTRHFGLPVLTADEPDASEILKDILKSSGLRQLTLHLRDGAATAAKRGERYGWHHFVSAFKDLKSLSKRHK